MRFYNVSFIKIAITRMAIFLFPFEINKNRNSLADRSMCLPHKNTSYKVIISPTCQPLVPPLCPFFSWCGSKMTRDIVMPTYDITEATLEMMGRLVDKVPVV